MNPRKQFCPNPHCPDKGKLEQGNIVSHSRNASAELKRYNPDGELVTRGSWVSDPEQAN